VAAVLPGVEDEARRLLQAASSPSSGRKLVLRLIGGVAVALRCPSAARPSLRRTYADMDFIAHERQSKEVNEFFVEMGYRPRKRFNALMGRKRLIFNDLANQRRADIFLDVFEMCHRFNFTERLDLEPCTLPLADLLATKLQIVEINDKDMKDITALLLDHGVGQRDGETVNGEYLARLCANDWGVYKTLTTNLSKIPGALGSYGLSSPEVERVKERAGMLLETIEREPKSFAWRMRARVGEKVRWYELPEADQSIVVDSRD
jgi:hypothetical protein